MTTPQLIIYDDGQGHFGPMTGLRPAFDIRTGAQSNLRRIENLIGRSAGALIVPDRLVGLVADRCSQTSVNPGLAEGGPCLLVNGRWLGVRFSDQVRQLEQGQAVVQADGQVIAAHLALSEARKFLSDGGMSLPDKTQTIRVQHRALMDRPWHILDDLIDVLTADLLTIDYPLIKQGGLPGVTAFGDQPIRIAPGAKVMPSVVLDASIGPVVVDCDAVINPLVVLQGPCYVGPGTEIASHANIRQGTILGERCKVGGEVSASIIDSYSNKAHAGYLGHSLVGSWSNLGAGTDVSNLKNTYGNVRIQLDEAAAPEDSGRTFHGAIIGDYVRTAIGTRLLTGAVIHTGCMIASSGWSPKFAAPLGFYTDQGCQAYNIEKLIKTILAMKARRGFELDKSEEAMIRSLGR